MPPRNLLPGHTPPPSARKSRPLPMRERMPWLPWVLPFALLMLLTVLEQQLTAFYPVVFTLKTVILAATLLTLRRFLPEAQPRRDGLGLAILLGIILTVAWIAIDKITPHFPKVFGDRVGFDPFQAIANPILRDSFLLVRFFGLVVIAPVCEELFYRGFLLRFVTDLDDFRRVPMGRFNMTAFAVNVLLMATSHPEWLAAAIFSAAMCGLLARTRSLFACIVAHGLTNLLLGIYILIAHDWKYW